MNILKNAAQMSFDGSISQKKRFKRIKIFSKLLSKYNHHDIKILDVGGSSEFWDIMNPNYEKK